MSPSACYSSRKLVDLQLHGVIDPQLFLPEMLTDALSRMAQLRLLSLYFLPRHDHCQCNIGVPIWSRKRIVLPALTHLNFRGNNTYLEDLVLGVDAPRQGDIGVASSNEIIVNVSKLSKFIDRIEMHKSHRRAYILSSEDSISVSFIRPGAPTRLRFQDSASN